MPLNYNGGDEEIIKNHEKWIYKKLSRIKAVPERGRNQRTQFHKK
jgi:hypothetical protein